MSVDTAFAQFEQLLLEEVEPSVLGLDLPGDDVAWNLMDTFPAIEKAGRRTGTNDYADGYECSWRIRLNRGARVTGGSFGGNSIVRMGPDNLINVGQQVDDLYLDPVHTPLRGYAKVTMELKKLQGQITANREQILSEIIASTLEEVAADGVEDAVFQVRETCCGLFWAPNAVLAQVNDGSGASITEAAIAWVPVDNGTPFRFTEGQRYVAAALSSGLPATPRAGSTNTPGVFRCVGIDTDLRKVGFQSEAGEGTISLSDNDGIMLEGIWDFSIASPYANRAPNSIENLIINTGTYPGTAYNVASHKELQAYISDNTATPVAPTPELIAEICDKVTEPGYEPPTTLVAERSVWTYYAQLERQAHVVYQVPQGAPYTASGGVNAPVITHGNYTFAKLSSAKVREGSIFGIAPETFRRFMPGGGKTLRWATQSGGVAGMAGIFHPIYSGRQMSKVAAADFEFWMQFGQVMPRRIFLIKGVLSQRTANA